LTVYGVTPQGFVIKPLTVIQTELTQALLGKVASDTDVAPDQPLGQLIGIFAAKLAEVWELAQVGYNATNRGDAEGDLLDNIGSLTGTTRLGETPSTVPCQAVFTAAGTYAAGSLAAFIASAASHQWTNQTAVVVPTLSNDGSAQPVSVTHPYTFSLANANALTWQSTIDGPSYADALIAAGEGSLSQLVPVAGWLSLADVAGPTIGTLVEEDAPYRVRQFEELSAPGSSTLDAIQAAILAVLPSGAVVEMYENTSMVTDGNGIPGKAYMAVVFDGTDSSKFAANDQLIAKAIWNNKPAGMQDYGTHSVVYVDSLGVSRSVYFTRSTAVPLYFAIQVAVAAGTTTPQQTAISNAIKTALVSASQGQPFTLYGTTFTPAPGAQTTLVPGADAVLNALRSIVQGQTGVLDVPGFTMSEAFPAVGTTNIGFPVTQVGLVQNGTDGSSNLYITVTFTTLTP
jgi:hypothetical protein